MKNVKQLLSAIGLVAAFGANAQTPNVLSDLKSGVQAITEPRAGLLGESAPNGEATRTIAISPNTHFVNVAYGDVVAFQSGGQEFTVRFDSASSVSSFDLQRLAPAGALDHPVTVYVAPSIYKGE